VGATRRVGGNSPTVPQTTIFKDLSNSGIMWGTSWNEHFTYDSSASRAVLHALPNANTFDSIVANTALVLVVISIFGSQTAFYSLDRNGYASQSYGSFTALVMTEITWWDFTQSAAFTANPSVAGAPQPYAF
jgi:hypothetical protein